MQPIYCIYVTYIHNLLHYLIFVLYVAILLSVNLYKMGKSFFLLQMLSLQHFFYILSEKYFFHNQLSIVIVFVPSIPGGNSCEARLSFPITDCVAIQMQFFVVSSNSFAHLIMFSASVLVEYNNKILVSVCLTFNKSSLEETLAST